MTNSTPRAPVTQETLERRALLYAREDMAKRAEELGCEPVATEWRIGVYDYLPDIEGRKAAYIAGALSPPPEPQPERFEWKAADGTRPSLVCANCQNRVPILYNGVCAECDPALAAENQRQPQPAGVRERIALRLAKAHDDLHKNDPLNHGAVTAYRAGVDMTIDYWNSLADAVLGSAFAGGGVKEALKLAKRGLRQGANRRLVCDARRAINKALAQTEAAQPVESNLTGCLDPEAHQGRCGYSIAQPRGDDAYPERDVEALQALADLGLSPPQPSEAVPQIDSVVFSGDEAILAAVKDQALEEAARVALAIDSGRGNEKEIARAIRAKKSIHRKGPDND